MKDVKKIFLNFESMLRQSKWFGDDWHIYNRGAYMHLYKGNWHNHRQGGIHFETYIEGREINKKAFPICMHVEDDCPNQSAFIRQFIDIERDRIEGWKGYEIGQGYSICTRILPLNFKNIEQRMLEEFNRLRLLEGSIDRVLAELEGVASEA